MIDLTLGEISITHIGQSSGFFMGEQNTLEKFNSKKIINEVVGISGDKNLLFENVWMKNKQKGMGK
ncbi:hypothetical protein [Neobacillus cucumis]|uniref:hypothetical protein n=1 Tax=Neobacillus cucumis TaxID=1740721 RepID=UPI002E1B7B65|nr:hypothetical protein [Neobacillus cucumis]